MWPNRNRNDNSPTHQAGAIVIGAAATTLDLAKYDLDGFRADVGHLLDLPAAARSIAARTLQITAVACLLMYFFAALRLGSTATFFFMAAAVLFTLIGAAHIAVFLLLRKRVDQTSAAASRVVTLVEMMHTDYQEVRSGGMHLPLREVGSEVAQQLVFPAVFGAAGQATTLAGPLGFVMRPALDLPMRWVESAVISALDELPGQRPSTPNEPEPLSEQQQTDIAIDEAAGMTAEVTSTISSAYEDIQRKLERIVGGLGLTALGPVGVLVLISLIPIATLVTITWWAT